MTTATAPTIPADLEHDEVLDRLHAEQAETIQIAAESRAAAEQAAKAGDPAREKQLAQEARELERRVRELNEYISQRVAYLKTERTKARSQLAALRKERVGAITRAAQTEANVAAANSAKDVRFADVLNALGELPEWQREMVIAKVGPETSRSIWADIATAKAAKAASDVDAIEQSIANATARLDELGGAEQRG